MPSRSHDGDAGVDLFSALDVELAPGQRALVPTGIAVAIPHGMVGLVQFLPTALLVFVAGHAADRFERKRVVQLCQIAEAATALFLAVSTFAGWLTVPQIFINDQYIGGSDELAALDQAGKLDALLAQPG